MKAILLATLLIASSLQAETGRTRIDVAGLAGPGWFLCDGIDAPAVVMAGKAAAGGAIRIALFDKHRPATPATVRTYRLGARDPGAGQVYWPLTQSGREAGNLHAFNPDAYGDAAAVRTPPFTSVKLATTEMQCRWRANTRLIAIAARRSLLVREDAAGHLVYESFDYATRPAIETPDGVQRTTRPSQRVPNGRETRRGGATTFRFANAGYTYTIVVPAAGPATLAIGRGDAVIQRETLSAYTLAP